MRAAVAALLLAAAPGCRAWGPITHYMWACSELAGQQDLQTCIKEHPDLISGDDFPDAFAFGSFIEGSNCTQFGAFHNNAFATLLVLNSKKWTPTVRRPRAFNATAFAIGYASHMYSDDVGFFRDGMLPPRGTTYLNWLKTWVFMVAIDSYASTSAGLRDLPVPELPAEGAEFVAQVAAQFKRDIEPAAPAITKDDVMYCAAAWQQALRDKTAEALQSLTATWRHQLVEFSPYSAASWEQAAQDIATAGDCVKQVWTKYVELVNAPGAKAGAVDAEVGQYIGQLYAAGKCRPQRLQDQKDFKYRGGLLGEWPEAG
eukprot:TRINITY_DN56951_c0_g1_i1.p2 TRINITY_DN56951_c0_g1~~TRINITY_DN56951_c0_g1_i1.p2  ORF type:complete len:338 (+),score=149.59 TRINITY_DN56951_c0_g1_i1:72-1016(+)